MAKGTFGERLKRERELREVPLEEISKATRISGRYLTALENEDWDKLPGGVFGHGFIRSIARYLGLDEEALLAEYDLARVEQAPPPPLSIPEAGIPRLPLWPFAVAAFVLLMVLVTGGIYGWRQFSAYRARHASPPPPAAPSTSVSAAPRVATPPPTRKSSSAPAPSSSPAPARTPTPVPPPRSTASKSPTSSPSSRPTTSTSPAAVVPATSSLLRLSITAVSLTHVRVVADRYLRMDRHLRPGESRHFTAKDHFEVIADDPGEVLLELNGRAIPPAEAHGASGRIILSRKHLEQAPGGSSQP